MSSAIIANADRVSRRHAGRVLPVMLTALLGTFLLWGVGFSHISAVHNAAHDVRHASGFPCH